MKRLIPASLALAFFVPSASGTSADRCSYHWSAWQSRHFARIVFDDTKGIPGHTLARLGYMESCLREPWRMDRVRDYNRELAADHSERVALSGFGSPDLANVPGVPYAFASCVAWRESTDGRLSWNIYGITSEYPGSTVSEQKHAFAAMYAQYGTAPWSRYDGC
jgi:hypothetical protein